MRPSGPVFALSAHAEALRSAGPVFALRPPYAPDAQVLRVDLCTARRVKAGPLQKSLEQTETVKRESGSSLG
jgi:hypothetical protein